jgi:hypothetical protein
MEMGYAWLCIRTAKKSLDERMRYRKRKSLDNRIREGKKAWMKGYDTEEEEPG